MGRRLCPSDRCVFLHRPASFAGQRRARARFSNAPLLFVLACACLWLTSAAMPGSAAFAQTAITTEKAKPATDSTQHPKMFVEADELVNNKDKNTVTAEGNARIYYKGRTLEADRVVYDRNTNRVYAEGHAKLTERDGTVLHAESFDLTDDFRDGRSLARSASIFDSKCPWRS